MRSIVIRSPILHFVDSPFQDPASSYEYYDDGLLEVCGGVVSRIGSAEELLQSDESLTVDVTYDPAHLLLPGFIDTHTHYPQTHMIASHGKQLLDWLNQYTFPAEMRFAEMEFARQSARFFLDQLLTCGTTTALVCGTVHPQSVDAFFDEASSRQLRMICGKVMMDCGAPSELLDTPEQSCDESRQAILKWHQRDGTRLHYAITPRYAGSSSPEQLRVASRLWDEFPDVHLHTHISENSDEIKLVTDKHPEAIDYLDIYDRYGLVRKQTVLAHCIHLNDREIRRMSDAGASTAFCPTSNLFLGSGLFDLRRSVEAQIPIGLGTDIGAGTSFSMFATMAEAYKVLQLQGQCLSPLEAFYLATLGGARALQLDHHIGNLIPGMDADFTVINLHATELLANRMQYCEHISEKLFALAVLGDDRAVNATYIQGEQWQRNRETL